MYPPLLVMALVFFTPGSGPAASGDHREFSGPGRDAVLKKNTRSVDGDLIKLWVYFGDREVEHARRRRDSVFVGISRMNDERTPGAVFKDETGMETLSVSTPSRIRRLREAGAAEVAARFDRPVGLERINKVIRLAGRLRTVNRWLNAVSVEITPAAARKIRELPFVVSTVPVRCWPREPKPVPAGSGERLSAWSSEFGYTDTQLGALGVRRLHNAGTKGEGVRIAVFDAGFWTGHRALAETVIAGKHDFVDGDDDPVLEEQAASHGTAVLSIIGGFDAGVFTGVAPDAEFLIARTEDLSSETPIEEDYWAAAVQWADSLGADIISSSLGYRWFDDPGDDHGYEELDGKTTVITRAAQTAARLGILVCNSMGNNGHYSAGTLSAPADADSILAVGAADSTGEILGFSSGGPTYDGRIKPDILSMGNMIWAAKYCTDSDTCYYRGGFSGTSAATPLAAGAAALVKQHLGCTALEARERLLETATRAGFPDNIYGHGMAVSWRAAGLEPPEDWENGAQIERVFPNPSGSGRFTVEFTTGGEQSAELSVCDASGRTLRFEKVNGADPWGVNRWEWDGSDLGGSNCPSGVYLLVLRAGSTNDIFKVAITR